MTGNEFGNIYIEFRCLLIGKILKNKRNHIFKMTHSVIKKLSMDEKKKGGIYFTPTNIILNNLESLFRFRKSFFDVLEPSCGSCEFLKELSRINECDGNYSGVEINEKIYGEIKDIGYSVVLGDFLKLKFEKKYDLIIGNPPYFVMKKSDVPMEFCNLFSGRPNIFIIFIGKCMTLLKDNGILSFILPSNFLNTMYYQKIRTKINKEFTILSIEKCNGDFEDTKQTTISFIIQKKPGDNKGFVIQSGKFLVFDTIGSVSTLKVVLEGSTTLKKLNLDVKIGNILLNSCKEYLSESDGSRLLHSSSISDNNELIFSKTKKNYINIDKNPLYGINLLVNRGYGTGKYNFKYALSENEFHFVENHLLVISGNNLDRVVRSFEDPRTKKFVEIYFSNGSINSTEMKEMFPIYI